MNIGYGERHHDFEGCFNFRDIGGYTGADGRKVRWGRYFRAGRQDRMTPADIERAKRLGIRTQIDLRHQNETRDQGPGPFPELGARYEWLPVISPEGSVHLDRIVGPGMSGNRYLHYLDLDPEPWRRIFEILAGEASHPVLVHCVGGKDRTGVVTALVLSILGVDRGVIEADYALTNRDVDRLVDFMERGPGFPDGFDRDSMLALAGVPEDAMGEFLDGIDREYGGAIAYLRGIGVDDDMQASIRQGLLEP